MAKPAPILVVAMGNAMAGDDAVGGLVAERVREAALAGVEVIDLAMRPAALLDHLAGRRALLIIDACRHPELGPGQMVEVDYPSPAAAELLRQRATSTHILSVADQLALAEKLGLLPPAVRLLAIGIWHTEGGRPMDGRVAASVPPAAARAVEWCRQRAGPGGATPSSSAWRG